MSARMPLGSLLRRLEEANPDRAEVHGIALGIEVWVQRPTMKAPVRAKVISITGPNARVRALVGGEEWTASIAELTPTAPSGSVGRAAVEAQQQTITRGYEHLTKARRIARGEER